MDPDSAGVTGYTTAPIPRSHACGNLVDRREKVYRLEIGISWIPAYAGMTDRSMPQRRTAVNTDLETNRYRPESKARLCALKREMRRSLKHPADGQPVEDDVSASNDHDHGSQRLDIREGFA